MREFARHWLARAREVSSGGSGSLGGSADVAVSPLDRADAFGYDCGRCGRCCRDKDVPLNPYEILLLARARGQSTTELLDEVVEPNWPVLRRRSDGSCALLGSEGCSVHAARPLACRLYPLARLHTQDGEERFERLVPRIGATGVLHDRTSLGAWLTEQDCAVAIEMSDRYQRLYVRVLDSVAALLGQPFEDAHAGHRVALTEASYGAAQAPGQAPHLPGFPAWFDIDAAVAGYGARLGLAVPEEIEPLVDLHVRAVIDWLEAVRQDD